MRRIGSVIVFKPEVTDEQAATALESIKHLVELPTVAVRSVRGKYVESPFTTADMIHQYDDVHGSGPVWYIP